MSDTVEVLLGVFMKVSARPEETSEWFKTMYEKYGDELLSGSIYKSPVHEFTTGESLKSVLRTAFMRHRDDFFKKSVFDLQQEFGKEYFPDFLSELSLMLYNTSDSLAIGPLKCPEQVPIYIVTEAFCYYSVIGNPAEDYLSHTQYKDNPKVLEYLNDWFCVLGEPNIF